MTVVGGIVDDESATERYHVDVMVRQAVTQQRIQLRGCYCADGIARDQPHTGWINSSDPDQFALSKRASVSCSDEVLQNVEDAIRLRADGSACRARSRLLHAGQSEHDRHHRRHT